MTPQAHRVTSRLLHDLRQIAGSRLRALVVFGAHAAADHSRTPDGPVHTLAIVDRFELGDLEACAAQSAAWTREGLATPLIVGAGEFADSLDAFPVEFGAIIARHEVVDGPDPFAALSVRPEDLRRACEVQARAHLLHLREGFIESRGEPSAIARLVTESAAPLLTLVTNVARVGGYAGGAPADAAAHVQQIAGIPNTALVDVVGLAAGSPAAIDPARVFPAYLAAVDRLTAYIDREWDSLR
jgi:hypothetical protein